MHRVCFFVTACVFAGCLWPGVSYAQLTVTPTRHMDFGELIIKDFNVVAQFVLHENTGITTGDANTIVLALGQNASFDVSGGPGNTAYTVTIDATTSPTLGGGGGGPSFTLDQFQTNPAVLQTDGFGNDTFTMGCRATTSGGGTVYTDGGYSGDYDFTVQF